MTSTCTAPSAFLPLSKEGGALSVFPPLSKGGEGEFAVARLNPPLALLAAPFHKEANPFRDSDRE